MFGCTEEFVGFFLIGLGLAAATIFGLGECFHVGIQCECYILLPGALTALVSLEYSGLFDSWNVTVRWGEMT